MNNRAIVYTSYVQKQKPNGYKIYSSTKLTNGSYSKGCSVCGGKDLPKK